MFGFLLDITWSEEKIFIKIKNLENDTIDHSITAFYPFEKLREIVEHKCKYIIFVSAERKKQNGKELFKFNKAVLLSGLTFDKFLDFTKQGIIKYDFRLGVYRKTKNPKLIGKNHDHGSGFRISKNNLSKVFAITELD